MNKLDQVPNGFAGHGPPMENDLGLKRSSSEPELGVVVKSCATVPNGLPVKVASGRSLSSASSGEFRQRAATHGDSTPSMKTLAMLRKRKLPKR